RNFGGVQELGAIEHALLAERQVLRAAQVAQALEHLDDVEQRARAHPIRVVLEPAFPVLAGIDLAVAEETVETIDFRIAYGLAKAYAVCVFARNEPRRLVRHHAELVKPAGHTHDGSALDLLNDAEPMIRVNDLVADLECHVAPSI